MMDTDLAKASASELDRLTRRLSEDPARADHVLIAALSAALAHHIHRHGIDKTLMVTGNMLRDELARQEGLADMQPAGTA